MKWINFAEHSVDFECSNQNFLENDWITLANDDDVKFALQHEPYLYVEVFTGLNESSRASSPVNSDSMVATRISEKEEVFSV